MRGGLFIAGKAFTARESFQNSNDCPDSVMQTFNKRLFSTYPDPDIVPGVRKTLEDDICLHISLLCEETDLDT